VENYVTILFLQSAYTKERSLSYRTGKRIKQHQINYKFKYKQLFEWLQFFKIRKIS